jgi:prephenate dehydratase
VTITVAYQGEPGAFSEAAITSVWGVRARPLPCASFGEVIAAIDSGIAEAGMLPTRNTIAGPVAESVAAIRKSQLVVVRETALPIHLDLLALPGATLESLRSVASHPVALLQCGNFLRAHPGLVPRKAYDTAGAARELAVSGDTSRAAIASTGAGARHGLVTMVAGIEDRTDNVTQFAIVARDASKILLSALDGRTPSANLER